MIETLLIDGGGSVAYAVGGARVLAGNIRRAGYQAALLHEKAVEVEKAQYPTSWDDVYSAKAIKARELRYRHGLRFRTYVGAVIWPLALLLRFSVNVKHRLGHDWQSLWTSGYEQAQLELKAKAEIARLEAEGRAELDAWLTKKTPSSIEAPPSP